MAIQVITMPDPGDHDDPIQVIRMPDPGDHDERNEHPFGTLGRLSSVERSNLADPALVFSYDYDFEGRTLMKTTPTSQWVSTTYSDTGWKVSDDVGSVAAGLTETVAYTYDDMGILDGWRLQELATGGYWDATMERSSPIQLAAMEYTHSDRPADSVRVDYGYTNAGWLASKAISPLFGTGDRLEYTYDKLRRIKNVRYADLNNDRDRYEYYLYDNAGNLTRFVEGHDSGLYQWNYTTPTQFGEIPERVEPVKGWSDTHTWDSVNGRMTSWTTDDALGVRARTFDYDGAGRLVKINNNGDETSLFYDVDDNVVWENRAGDVYRRFEGYRAGPNSAIESMLPMLRVEIQDFNGQEVRLPRVVMLDVDGHALYTWETTGDELSREITGAYGMPMRGADWDSGPNWELDGLHGSEEDRMNQVAHFGARHTLFRDGMWMQPEPLLALGNQAELIQTPGNAGGTYAAARPTTHSDTTGFAADAPFAIYFFVSSAGEGTVPAPVSQVLDGVLRGDFIQNPTGWQSVGQIAGGFLPQGDVRDIIANVTKGDGVGTLMAGVGSVPVAGDAAKAVWKSTRKACFVAGTTISMGDGALLPIEEVEAGDRVIAYAPPGSGDDRLNGSAAFTDDSGEEWVAVESDKLVNTAAWSPRGVCSRIAGAGRRAMIPMMLAACDPASAAAELPSDVATVQVYDSRTGGWDAGLAGDLEVGDEVFVDGHVLRVGAEGVEDRGFAEVGQLSEADSTWVVDGLHRIPSGGDWVLVLGDGDVAGHWRLDELVVGERFAFQGRVFETGDVKGELAVRATGDVLGRVVDTFVRMAPEVIDAEISYADGTTDVLTGTPNHPFWVDAIRDYAPLGDLKVGTKLHVQGGGDAVLISKTWRQGDFEVFDFEVEGLHNFYVRGPGGDAAGVLVHNSKGKGSATFHRYDGNVGPTGRHVTVEVKDAGGNSLGEFHQTGVKNSSLQKVEPGDINGTRTRSSSPVELDNPQGAADFGSSGFPTGKNKRGHDCVTGACAITNQGSPNKPVNPKGVRIDLGMQ